MFASRGIFVSQFLLEQELCLIYVSAILPGFETPVYETEEHEPGVL